MAASYRWCGVIVLQMMTSVSNCALAIEGWFNGSTKAQEKSTDQIWDEWLWDDDLWQNESKETEPSRA